MQVTSETLFHFTTSLKNLQNILSKKFHLTYCKEKYTLNYETHDNYYPMISFCDIPLSLANNQMKNYGSYAIGMTKEWGIKNKLNPVVYLEKDSLLAEDIQGNLDDTLALIKIITAITEKNNSIIKTLSSTKYYEKNHNSIRDLTEKINFVKDLTDPTEKRNYINKLTEQLNDIKTFDEKLKSDATILRDLSISLNEQNKLVHDTSNSKINFFRYVKNYQGTLVRQNKTFKDYRFYDEREWRYVPAATDKRVEVRLNEEQFKKYRGSGKSKPLLDKITLDFTSQDIKFLIVKSNKDIPKLIKSIHSIDNLSKNSNNAHILTTRILTVEQLKKDF